MLIYPVIYSNSSYLHSKDISLTRTETEITTATTTFSTITSIMSVYPNIKGINFMIPNNNRTTINNNMAGSVLNNRTVKIQEFAFLGFWISFIIIAMVILIYSYGLLTCACVDMCLVSVDPPMRSPKVPKKIIKLWEYEWSIDERSLFDVYYDAEVSAKKAVEDLGGSPRGATVIDTDGYNRFVLQTPKYNLRESPEFKDRVIFYDFRNREKEKELQLPSMFDEEVEPCLVEQTKVQSGKILWFLLPFYRKKLDTSLDKCYGFHECV